MPDIEVMIGGRNFLVSCQPGEEHFLRSAAAQLDVEAQPLIATMGRLPEAKMLLMAGLMLADRTAAQEDEMRALRARLSELEDRPEPEAKRIEVPVIPPQVPQTFAELAARIEAMAERIDEKVAAMQRDAGAGLAEAKAVGETGPGMGKAAVGPAFGFGDGRDGDAEADPVTQPDADPGEVTPGDPPQKGDGDPVETEK